MAKNGLVPERVYCSSARRAVETWKLVSKHLADAIQVDIRDGLYQASPGDLLAMLHGLPATVDRILMVGHNPTMEELASSLAGDGREESLDALDHKYPTGALAVFEFSVESWSDVRKGTGYLRDLVLPRSLKD
jgi:phosphohistidine phosphatase